MVQRVHLYTCAAGGYELTAFETRDALQEDTNRQLLKHVLKVLIFDQFREIVTSFQIDK